MKKTAIAIAVALAGFATVAQAAPKDNTGMQVVNWVGLSSMTPVGTTAQTTMMAQLMRASLVQVRSVAIRLTRMLALKWVTTG